MTTTARAAVFQGAGKGFELRDVPIPEIEPDAVLVRITRAGICESELHFWRGDSKRLGPRSERGQMFGHEMTGQVAALGSNVKTDSLGRALKEGVSTYHPAVLPKALSFLQRNRERFPFDKMVSHHFPLDQINQAFEQSEWYGRSGDTTQITRAMITP